MEPNLPTIVFCGRCHCQIRPKQLVSIVRLPGLISRGEHHHTHQLSPYWHHSCRMYGALLEQVLAL